MSSALKRNGETMRIARMHILLLFIALTISLAGCNNSDKNPEKEYSIPTGKDINFYIATDLHYLSKSLTDGGEAFQNYTSSGDGKQLEYIDEILRAFTFEIKNKKPDILIISGDLTSNGEKESHLALSQKFKEIENAGTSVYVVPGNHDLLNPWARGFKGNQRYETEKISDKEFCEIYGDFGYNEAISRDKHTISYLVAPAEDVWLLMLDTNQYKNNWRNGAPQTDGQISQGTFQWIKKCSALAKEKGAALIPVMHHSLIDHSDVIQKGYTLNNNKQAIAVFQNCDVDFVLSGHIHIQDISSYRKDANTIYDIATNALSVYPHQYGVLKYSWENAAFDYSTSRVDVEGWSKAEGITDRNTNNFSNYSEEFFGKRAYDMAYHRLIEEPGFTEREIKSMSEIVELLNLRYFAGTEVLNSTDVINSEGFALWNAAPDSFLKRYVMSILRDKDTEDNELRVQIRNKNP